MARLRDSPGVGITCSAELLWMAEAFRSWMRPTALTTAWRSQLDLGRRPAALAIISFRSMLTGSGLTVGQSQP